MNVKKVDQIVDAVRKGKEGQGEVLSFIGNDNMPSLDPFLSFEAYACTSEYPPMHIGINGKNWVTQVLKGEI